jgi:hypothetical protein
MAFLKLLGLQERVLKAFAGNLLKSCMFLLQSNVFRYLLVALCRPWILTTIIVCNGADNIHVA